MPPPTGTRAVTKGVDWGRVALDWIDLLIIVGLCTTLTFTFQWLHQWIGWRPRGVVVGLLFGPPALAALGFRRKVLPPKDRGPVDKRLSLLGFVATLLMIFGLLVGLFGAFGAQLQLSTEAAPVSEHDVSTLAQARAAMEVFPQVGEAVSGAEALARKAEAPGTFEDLMAELDKGPSAERIAHHEAEVRSELQHEAEMRAKERREGGIWYALRVVLLSFGMIALGGYLDSRRRRLPLDAA